MNKCGPSKDPENRSKKDCCCGGHNSKNVSRNLNHNSTRSKHEVRVSRKEWKRLWRDKCRKDNEEFREAMAEAYFGKLDEFGT